MVKIKRITHKPKKARRKSSTAAQAPQRFSLPSYQERYGRLSQLKFGKTQDINLAALDLVGLSHDTHELLHDSQWEQLMAIDEPTYKELTLEVLSTV